MTRARRGLGFPLIVALATSSEVALGAEPTKAAPDPPATDAPATPEAAPPAPGEPTKEQCIDANEAAQKLLRTGGLAAAREKVAICVAASCPEPIRVDCAELTKAIQAATPTVRFEARDKDGTVVTDVRVTMDGQPFAERLDGTPLEVEPGRHKFVFESPGLPRTTKTLDIKAGEQRGDRVELVDMTGPLLRTTGLVLAGVGVLSIGYGTFRAIRAKTTYDDALEHCPNGPNSCSQAGVDGGEDAHDDAAAATTTIAVGSVLVAGGAALYFFVPVEGFRVTPGVRSGGLTLEASATW